MFNLFAAAVCKGISPYIFFCNIELPPYHQQGLYYKKRSTALRNEVPLLFEQFTEAPNFNNLFTEIVIAS